MRDWLAAFGVQQLVMEATACSGNRGAAHDGMMGITPHYRRTGWAALW